MFRSCVRRWASERIVFFGLLQIKFPAEDKEKSGSETQQQIPEFKPTMAKLSLWLNCEHNRSCTLITHTHTQDHSDAQTTPLFSDETPHYVPENSERHRTEWVGLFSRISCLLVESFRILVVAIQNPETQTKD